MLSIFETDFLTSELIFETVFDNESGNVNFNRRESTLALDNKESILLFLCKESV